MLGRARWCLLYVDNKKNDLNIFRISTRSTELLKSCVTFVTYVTFVTCIAFVVQLLTNRATGKEKRRNARQKKCFFLFIVIFIFNLSKASIKISLEILSTSKLNFSIINLIYARNQDCNLQFISTTLKVAPFYTAHRYSGVKDTSYELLALLWRARIFHASMPVGGYRFVPRYQH